MELGVPLLPVNLQTGPEEGKTGTDPICLLLAVMLGNNPGLLSLPVAGGQNRPRKGGELAAEPLRSVPDSTGRRAGKLLWALQRAALLLDAGGGEGSIPRAVPLRRGI